MAYFMNIAYDPKLSVEDNLKAVMNVVDFLSREMSVGRVPGAAEAARAAQASADGLTPAVGAMQAAQGKRWDGLKWVYDPEDPIPLLALPAPVEPNAVYRAADGTRWVGVKQGTVTEETWDEYLAAYESEAPASAGDETEGGVGA